MVDETWERQNLFGDLVSELCWKIGNVPTICLVSIFHKFSACRFEQMFRRLEPCLVFHKKLNGVKFFYILFIYTTPLKLNMHTQNPSKSS